MNRQERRRWMRRHVASELAARSTREREARREPGPPDDYVPETRPFVLAFELADDEPDGRQPSAADRMPATAAPDGASPAAPPKSDPVAQETYESEGDAEAALDRLDQVTSKRRGTDFLLTRAVLLARLGRYDEAEREVRSVVRAEPANAEAHFRLGVVISKRGLWRDAIPHLRRAVELDPARAEGHYYLGEALNHVDDLDGALQSFQRAAELRPNNANTLYGLGIVLDRLNRPDDAAQMYRRSRELAGR